MCKKICVINFFVFFLLFFLNNKFLHANIKPYCDNKISQDFFYKIDHNLPQLIEIKVNKNRKWQKNNLRIIKDNSGIIQAEDQEDDIRLTFNTNLLEPGPHFAKIVFL